MSKKETNVREDMRQLAVKVIEEWKGFWMNQIEVTKDQADHDNYYCRALGVDANMKYNLAGKIADLFDAEISKRDEELRKANAALAAEKAKVEEWKQKLSASDKLIQSGVVIENAEYKEFIDLMSHFAAKGLKKAIAYCLKRHIPFNELTPNGDLKERE